MVEISLLPKEEPQKPKEEKPVEVKAKGIFPTRFLAIGILLVLVGIGITGGLFIYKNALSANLERLGSSVNLLKEEEEKYTPTENEAKLLQTQLNNLQNLISKHKYWSDVMETLAGYTPLDVQYKSIVCEEKDNKFTVTGWAKNYAAVAQLMVSLRRATSNKETFFDSIDLDSAKLGFDENKQIRVEFSVSFNLKKDALLHVPKIESSSESKPEKKNVVYISLAEGYKPQELTIKAGEEVTWINQDTVTHRITSADGLFDSGDLASGKSYTYKFEKQGKFIYYCPIHSPGKQYTGTIIVE